MRKRFCAIILAVAMVMTMIPVAVAASPSSYDDISGHWAESSIDRWSGYGVVNGAGDGQFAPDRTLTRAEAAQIFANLLGLTAAASLGQYVDVAVGSWYYDAIAKCVAAGILTGTGGATMSPETVISRQELFVMYARALSIQPKTSADTSFTDSASVASWAAGYINALADMGAIQGGGDGSLDPAGDINRASFVALLDQSISGYANTDNATVGGTSGIVLVVADDVTVMGNVESLVVVGGSAGVSGSSVGTITVTGDNASVSVGGSASVGQVNVTGANAAVTVSGEAAVTTVTVADTAANTSVTVSGSATVSAVDSAASGVTISGTGTVETATVSGSNTTVNTSGTDLTVSQGTTGVTENGNTVAGGTTVETKPETQQPEQPVTPPVHIHSYIATEIKAADAPETTVAVQYTCYAGDHSYIELNGNAAARVGSDYYVDVSNALSTADNATVTMLKDAVFTDTCIVTGTVTLDMNGRTISNTSGIWDQYAGKWSLISVQDDGDLTITGNGTLSTLKDDIYAVDVYDATSSCTIESGTFIGNIHAVYVRNGSLTVNGGTYSIQQLYGDTSKAYEFVLNCYDAHYKAGTAKITVTGGTFENFNPADCAAEGEDTNFVANGYTVTPEVIGEDTRYTVVPLTAENSAAVVNGVYYENLTDAIAAADNATVTMLKNAVFTDTCIVTGTVTLDMNGHTISNTKDIWVDTAEVDRWSLISVRGNGNLTITGNGTLQAKANDCYAIDVYDTDSACTVESGTFIGNISAIYVFSGTLNVKGGTFSIQQKETGDDGYRFMLNCYDDHYKNKTAKVTVTGGTFGNFNPADCAAEGESTNFVAEGYTVTPQTADNDIWYTVEPLTAEDSAAEVDGVYYESLTDAIEAADDNATIIQKQLLKNF